MEFYKYIDARSCTVDELKESLSIANMPELCESINNVISDRQTEGDIYCLWGQFNVRRDEIKYGIRFSLLNCPHALAWTITLNEQSHKIVIHCTIDKENEDRDFIDSIDDFMADWAKGLSSNL
jgi:DNA transposition AAA+ family ATPase